MERLTSWLDLIGILLIIAAAALAAGAYYMPAGVGIAGAGLLVASWLIDRRRAPQ